MKKYIFLISLVFFSIHLYGQEQIRSYVEKNIISIQTINPNDTDYSDLAQIGSAIGNAKVVMIGEQEHGDGTTFLAKTRLIQYLHEKKGFNVLAFESDFFSMNAGWEKVPKVEDSIKVFLRRNILSAWSACGQCDELLYTYVPKTYQTNTPLIMSGFDSEFTLNYSNYHINQFVHDYLLQSNIPYVSSPEFKTHFLSFIPYLRFLTTDKITELKNFEGTMNIILQQLKDKNQNEFGIKVLENLQELARREFAKDGLTKTNIRDNQMAKNLDWLVKIKYPNEKIIVWAANGHIMKNSLDAIKNRPYKWMGTVFTKDLQNNNITYVLGFNSKRGLTKWASDKKPTEIKKAARNGFESWIDEKYKYAFIDFKSFRNANPNSKEYFTLKGEGHNNFKGIWTDIFDGVFYIRDMEPCTESNYNHLAY